MGYLFHIFLALASLAVADLGARVEVSLPAAWWTPLVLVPVPYLLLVASKRAALRGSFRAAGFYALLLAHSAPLLQLIAVMSLGWVEVVGSWFGAGETFLDWPETALLAGIVPFVLYELVAIDARARFVDPRLPESRGRRRFQARLFLSGLVPMLVYAAVASLVGLDPVVRAHVEGVALLNAAFAVVLLVGFALALPTILRWTWDTAPLGPGVDRSVLEAVAKQAGFRCKELLLWRTANRMPNAAIVGFAPWHRFVLFTDALLAQLGPRQLAAVFGHEIGHARRHHMAIFATWVLGFVMLADVLRKHTTEAGSSAAIVLLGVLALVWYVGFGFLSRRFELEADLASLEIVGDPDALIDALDRVGIGHGARRSTWRHFGIDERRLFLRAAARDPEVGKRLRRGLRRLTLAGVLVFVVGAALELGSLAGTWNEDRVWVDLELGRFERADGRARSSDDVDPELVELAAIAAGLGDRTEGDSIASEARRALSAGEVETAGSLLLLAELRGRRDLRPIRDALQLAWEGDAEAAAERLWDFDDPDSDWPELARSSFARAAELGTEAAELGTEAAELGTEAAELGTEAAELGTEAAELGTDEP